MNNLYYIVNTNLSLVKNKLEELNSSQQYEITYYDYPDKNIQEVIEELDTINFLVPHKMIVLTSSTFLATSIKRKDEKELEPLLKYIKNPNPDHILVFVTDKLYEKNKIVTELKKQAKLLKVETDIKDIIKKAIAGYKYDEDFIKTLLDYTNNDIDLSLSEVEKLKILKIDEKELTKEDVIASVRRNIDDSDQVFFTLIDHIINKNIKRSLEIYQDLKKSNIEETKIIATLASQLRLMYQVKCLEGATDQQIANRLKVKLYPVKKARERAYSYSKKQLAKLLKDLFDIDFQIKTSTIDKSLAIEMFIYNQK